MILGLDLSTTRSGWALVRDDGSIYRYGAIELAKFKNIFEKASKMEEFLRETEKEGITHIFIERALYSFKKGRSSAQTLATLQAFNGIISFICYKIFNIEPKYLSAIQARNKVGLNIKRGQLPKPLVVKFLLENFKEFGISYTKFGNIAQKHFDEADAITVALAGFKCLNKKK